MDLPHWNSCIGLWTFSGVHAFNFQAAHPDAHHWREGGTTGQRPRKPGAPPPCARRGRQGGFLGVKCRDYKVFIQKMKKCIIERQPGPPAATIRGRASSAIGSGILSGELSAAVLACSQCASRERVPT